MSSAFVPAIQLEPAFGIQLCHGDIWTLDGVRGRKALPAVQHHSRGGQSAPILLEPDATALEALPPDIVYESRRARPSGRQPQVRVVGPQEQPVLGARREQAVGLETTLDVTRSSTITPR